MKKPARSERRKPSREYPSANGGRTVPECAPFEARVAPSAVLPFRQAVELLRLGVGLGDPIEGLPTLELACVQVARPDGIRVSLALDLAFAQVWLFEQALIADLHSTFSLAPLEAIRLELKVTQRKSLQQSVVDSVEEIQATESTVVDKEVLNVARSSSHTNNWNVDGSGSFSLGGLSFGASGGTSETVTRTASSSAEQLHESTRKSSENLKTLHKVETVGLSETTTEERLARRIRNPYRDRSLTVNVLQLLKRYQVTTSLASVRPVLVIGVRHLVMDRAFVLANGGFLRANLLDTDLVRELVQALAAARRPMRSQNQDEAKRIAREALRYLFEVPNVFNVQPAPNNDPAVSYDASFNVPGMNSGFSDSVNNNAGLVFTALNLFFKRFTDLSAVERDAEALSIAVGLASGIRPAWDALAAAGDDLKKVLDVTGLTEALRRVPGFLVMVDAMLRPLLEPAEQERDAEAAAERAEFVIGRVVEHLHCHREYYLQRFLQYVAAQTGFITLAEFVRDVIGRLTISPSARDFFLSAFARSRAFIDRSEIVVPTVGEVPYADLVRAAGGKWL